MPNEERARQEIGRRIKELRLSRGLTIKELADEAGMSPGYLSEVERGKSALSGLKAGVLADRLGTTTDYILTGRGEPHLEGAEIKIPTGLAEAAEMLDLTYATTIRLLRGKKSMVAERRDEPDDEWPADKWIAFHTKVAPFL